MDSEGPGARVGWKDPAGEEVALQPWSLGMVSTKAKARGRVEQADSWMWCLERASKATGHRLAVLNGTSEAEPLGQKRDFGLCSWSTLP